MSFRWEMRIQKFIILLMCSYLIENHILRVISSIWICQWIITWLLKSLRLLPTGYMGLIFMIRFMLLALIEGNKPLGKTLDLVSEPSSQVFSIEGFRPQSNMFKNLPKMLLGISQIFFLLCSSWFPYPCIMFHIDIKF